MLQVYNIFMAYGLSRRFQGFVVALVRCDGSADWMMVTGVWNLQP
jgi:hypothetical protein